MTQDTHPETIDSHHHFWNVSMFEYPWMPPGSGVLRRNYLPEDLRPILSANDISRTIIVQAHQSLEEANFLLDLAVNTDFVAGVVAWVDLKSPSVGDDIDELTRRPGLVSIRHQIEDEPDPAWMVQDEVIVGLKELAKRGIGYDMLVKPPNLKYVPYVAQQVPDLRMVINHIGKPFISRGIVEPWKADISEIAKIPGVYCKISGMVTEADHVNWSVEDLKPYVSHVAETFGSDRIMFGSDWPVCLLASDYAGVKNAAITALGQLAAKEQSAFLGGNAANFYGLNIT